MGLGAVAWLAGNGLWTRGHEIPQVVLWWLTFLLLTIVGERIELTRFQKPSRSSRPWLLTTLVILGAGLAIGWFAPRAGGVLTGAALLVIAAWLMRFDLAWRTIRHPGAAAVHGSLPVQRLCVAHADRVIGCDEMAANQRRRL